MGSYRGEAIRFLKFAATGVLNTGVDTAVFTVLILLGAGEYLAQGLGYSCGMLCSYLINRRWTFKSADRLVSPTALRFTAANLCLLALSLVAVYISRDILQLSIAPTKAIAVCCTVGLGFFINRFWVFKAGSCGGQS